MMIVLYHHEKNHKVKLNRIYRGLIDNRWGQTRLIILLEQPNRLYRSERVFEPVRAQDIAGVV